VKREFDKYFRVMHNFLEVVVSGRAVTLEAEPESTTVTRLNLKHAEFLYPVGGPNIRMFRVAEENPSNIYTIKICSLLLSDLSTYQPFIGCVKEAMLLSKAKTSGGDVLGLRGYFLVARRTFRFWDLHYDLVLLLEDHDLTLLDIIRARKHGKLPWPKEYVEPLLKKMVSIAEEAEKAMDCKLFYFNPINIVYSKAAKKFMLANLNNVWLSSEWNKLKSISQGRGAAPNALFQQIFPDLAALYTSPNHNNISDQTCPYSISIMGMQMAEVSLGNEEAGKELFGMLEDKMRGNLDTKSMRASQALQRSLGGFGSRLLESMATDKVPKFESKPDKEAQVEIELKPVNHWKEILRGLSADYSHVKYLREAHLFLVAGNAKKAVTSCKKAIEEFTRVKDLDVLDWIDLLGFLVNAFMRINVQDQAKLHAQSLAHYMEKAVRIGRFPAQLAKADTLALRSLSDDPISILQDRDSWGLSSTLSQSVSYYLYYLGLESPDKLLQYLNHTGSTEGSVSRAMNFEILYKLYLGQVDGLKGRLKK